MKKYWKKFKTFWFELGNLFTNILCPFLSAIAAILELFNAPAVWTQNVKKAEYWCWNACGTKEKIDEIIVEVDKTITNSEEK